MLSQPHTDDQVLAICALIEAMTGLSAPPPLTPPSPPDLAPNPAQLGIDSAKSATAIAHAVARLGNGNGNDQSQATIIWNETLNQMQRIQNLYNLPPYPFQSQALPPGASKRT